MSTQSTNQLDFRNEFSNALREGKSYEELRRIVIRQKNAGMSQQAAYDTLEIVREGIDESDEATIERIEDVMDDVWGYCNLARRIWSEGASS